MSAGRRVRLLSVLRVSSVFHSVSFGFSSVFYRVSTSFVASFFHSISFGFASIFYLLSLSFWSVFGFAVARSERERNSGQGEEQYFFHGFERKEG